MSRRLAECVNVSLDPKSWRQIIELSSHGKEIVGKTISTDNKIQNLLKIKIKIQNLFKVIKF